MKNYLIKLTFVILFVSTFSSCSNDDTQLPELSPAVFSENFSRPTEQPEFNFEGWTKFSQAGTKEWFKNSYQGDDYIEFSSFGSGQSSNIAWAISPVLNIDSTTSKTLIFQSAQHHATSLDNKFELLVSTNFDGTNVLSAKWEILNFRKPSYTTATNYDFVNSGPIDLSSYSGNIYRF